MQKSVILKSLVPALFLACNVVNAAGQDPQPTSEKNHFSQHVGGYVMGPSWHSDRTSYFNEVNLGGAVTWSIGKPNVDKKVSASVLGGAYYNSVRTITPIAGAKIDYHMGHGPFSVGLLAGVAGYPQYRKNDRITLTQITTNEPEKYHNNSPQDGVTVNYTRPIPSSVLNIQNPNGAFALFELETDKRAQGEGPIIWHPLIVPEINAQFSENWGLMIQGGYLPDMGAVFNAAVTFKQGIKRKK